MNIVLAGNFDWTKDDIEELSSNGKDTVFICRNEEQSLPLDADRIDVVVCNWFFKYHNINEFTSLKYIQLLSVGYNGIDGDIVHKMGIELHNARDVYSIPISEFVIGNILAIYKQNRYFLTNQWARRWEKNRGLQELYEKKVLIVGTGSIGVEIAKRISVFTPFVYGCNRTIRSNPHIIQTYPLSEFEEIVADFDILIFTIALARETKYLVDKQVLSKIKNTALIVNVSRGAIIEESGLISFLSENKSAGAVLDVFEEEPLPNESPLWGFDNVILTPHNAFVSNHNNDRLREVILKNYHTWRKEL